MSALTIAADIAGAAKGGPLWAISDLSEDSGVSDRQACSRRYAIEDDGRPAAVAVSKNLRMKVGRPTGSITSVACHDFQGFSDS